MLRKYVSLSDSRLLIALSSLALFFCFFATWSLGRIGSLAARNDTYTARSMVDALDLFAEQQEFLSILGRRGYTTRDQLQFASRCRRELEEFARDPPNEMIAPLMIAEAAHRLAQMQIVAGDRRSALGWLIKSVDVSERERDIRRLGLAENTLGVFMVERGNLEEAEVHFLRAEECLQKIPAEREIYAIAIRNLAITRAGLGNHDIQALERAIGALELSYEESRFCPATEISIDTRIELANAFLALGDCDQAILTMERANKDLRFLMDETVGSNLENDILSYRRLAGAHNLLRNEINRLRNVRGNDGARIKWNWLFEMPTETLDSPGISLFQMVGEFEPQTAIAVPWTGYRWVNETSLEVIRNVRGRLRVIVVVTDQEDYQDAFTQMQVLGMGTDELQFATVPIDSPWLRDSGPIAGRLTDDLSSAWVDSQVLTVDMKQRVEEDALPRLLARSLQTHLFRTALSVHGGEILTNGNGLLVCAANVVGRNVAGGFLEQQVRSELKRITGAQSVIYLEGLDGESTQHLDMFMTFVSADTVVVGEYRNQQQKNAKLLNSHARKLAAARLANGRRLNVVRVPMPQDPTQNFPNYTNVVYANGVLLVPSWAHVSDEIEAEVTRIYQELLPTWQVASIDCTNLARTGGAIHCLTSNLGIAASQDLIRSQ